MIKNNAEINRGDVFWIDFGSKEINNGSEIYKTRPGLVISANFINKVRKTIIAIPISSSAIPRDPINIAVSSLDKKGVAICDQLRAIDKRKLKEKIGSIGSDDIKKVEDALRQIICL